MSGRAIRLSCVVATGLSFLALWGAIAAHPWASAAKRIAIDPRLAALADKQRRLQYEAEQVKSLLRRRWAVYGRRLSKREQEIALIESRHRTALAAARAARARIAAELAARAAAQTASQHASLTSVVSPAGTVSTASTHTVTPSPAAAGAASTPAAPAPAPTSPAPPPPVVTVVATTPVTTTKSSSQ